MFGKKKKQPKVEQVFESAENGDKVETTSHETSNSGEAAEGTAEAAQEHELSKAEQEKLEKIDDVKSKISKILQSSNIEIIDENEGDEYELSDQAEKQQQDYDSLKALFGASDKTKKQELTLTIDEYDYTYTGQYVEEFDLMHLKSIKKVRLQRRHKKLTKRLMIAGAALTVVAIVVVACVMLMRKVPVTLQSIALSETEQSYYLNESFDYRGIYIYATYSNGTVQRIKLDGSYLMDTNGYVDRQNGELYFTSGQEARLIFSYQGFTADIKINIITKRAEDLTEWHTDALLKLEAGDYITEKDLIVILNYSNYESELVNFSELQISINSDILTYSENGFYLQKSMESYGADGFITILHNATGKTITIPLQQ